MSRGGSQTWTLPPQMSKIIWCFFIGGNKTFSVKIDPTESVDALKNQIKSTKSHQLSHVDADDLILYRAKINSPIEKDERIKELGRLSQNLDECLVLDDEEQEVSEIFGDNPPGEKYYTLVWIPEGE